MKKIFTLISVALVAMSANAQSLPEIWDAQDADLTNIQTQTLTENIYGGGTADAPDTSIPSSLTSYIIQASTTSIVLTAHSTPNIDQNNDIIKGDKKAWELKGNGAIDPANPDKNRNQALDKEDGYPDFYVYLAGMGNPSFVHWEFDEETENGTSHRAYDTFWTPEATTYPAKGAYWKFDTKAEGTLILGIYNNNGNRPLYVYNGTDKAMITNDKIDVAVYYQNNGFSYANDGDGNPLYLNEGKMASDYIVQHTNGITQNRPCLGYITFDVAANKSYYVFNSTSQLGLYGFYFQPTEVNAISTVKAAAQAADAPIYNLSGQQVSKDYKGVVIQNGVKRIQK